MELDTIGDEKTVLFLIMSDTDTTFNFILAMLQSQLINLLCDRADDKYGGRLPVHASIHVQLSFLNRKVDPVQYAKSFEIAPQGDDFDDIRTEYTAILQKQLASGNNGIVKTKYLTFTIEADSLKTARARLTRIGLDLLGYFKTMGCVAHIMDGQERLEVLHGIFHPDGEPFRFDWDWLAPSGLSTKDFVAPSSLCFGTAKTFGLGGKYGAVSFLQILAPELSDEMLADFLKTESGILVNLHVQAIDQTEAIKTIKRKITDLDAMKIQEQKKAVRSGYDMDILPSDLATYGEDAKKLLNKLQTRNERLFMLTFLVLNKQNLFQSERVIIGKCPRCSENVYEGKKNFYCGNRSCQFVMWKNDRFFEQRKKAFTPKIAAALLKNGKAKVKGLYSEKTGKTYDATVLLADTGGKYVNYRVERKE